MNERSTFARRVRAATPRNRRRDIRDDVVPGLILRVYPSGARSFTFETMVRGRRRYATVGNADAMTIPEARREALSLIANYTKPASRDSGRHPSTLEVRTSEMLNPAPDFLRGQEHRVVRLPRLERPTQKRSAAHLRGL